MSNKEQTQKSPKAFLTNYKRFLIVLAICLIINGLVSFLFFSFLRSGGEKAKVPDLRNLNLLDAVSLLQSNNLKVNITANTSQTIPKFVVISQSPKAGNIVKEGREIIVTISSGPSWLDFPNYVGKNINQIKSVFQNASANQKQIYLDKIVFKSSAEKAGTIIGQHPLKKELVKAQVGLTLYVSNGDQTTIPSLVNKPLEEALYKIKSSGNLAYEIQYKTSSAQMDGKVLSQNPAAGSKLSDDFEVIHLFVGKWSQNQSEFKVIQYKVSADLNKKTIKMVFNDNRGAVTVYEGEAISDQNIIRVVPSYGSSRCIIYEIQGKNEKFIKELSL